MARGYEPASGWNLPPGCTEGDPRAPWNEADPSEGRTCGECALCRPCAMLGGGDASVCEDGSGDLWEVDPRTPACGDFESR